MQMFTQDTTKTRASVTVTGNTGIIQFLKKKDTLSFYGVAMIWMN